MSSRHYEQFLEGHLVRVARELRDAPAMLLATGDEDDAQEAVTAIWNEFVSALDALEDDPVVMEW